MLFPKVIHRYQIPRPVIRILPDGAEYLLPYIVSSLRSLVRAGGVALLRKRCFTFFGIAPNFSLSGAK